MSLKKNIFINEQFAQSINVERDESSIQRIDAYVPTAVTKRSLESFINASKNSEFQKAWSFIGPYGSGKSFFAVFLSALLSNPKEQITQAANKKLKEFDSNLAKEFKNLLKSNDGYLKILISGSVEPIEVKIYEALVNTIQENGFSQILKEELKTTEPTSSEVLKLLSKLQDHLAKESRFSGIVMVIDELGKFVQFAGRNKNQGDLFLLQQLAENTALAHQCSFNLIAMLHQSLDVYAKDLDEETKNEWKKIQGRFNEISFIESPEQSIRILAQAIQQKFSSQDAKKINTENAKILKILENENALPPGMNLKESEEIFLNCYPLHPSTAALLPILSQRIGQNERTMFSYLGSQHEFGFKELLENKDLGDFIMPHDLFDYFVTNQTSYISDHASSQQWLEVSDALHHLGDTRETLTDLIKSIGIISIIGKRGGLLAKHGVLETIFQPVVLKNELSSLKEKRLVKYSDFSETYKVWEGSDIDVESELKHELAQLGSISAAEELNNLAPLNPLIAMKHSIENGLLRYFEMEYMDESKLSTYASSSKAPKLIVLLKGRTFKKEEYEKLLKQASKTDVFVEVDATKFLMPMIEKFVAYNNLSNKLNQDNSDRVGRREVMLKLDECEMAINSEIKNKINPLDSTYFWQGKKLEIESTRELQNELSKILDSIYTKGPKVFNELINRDALSSQGASARVKLLKAMLEAKSLENLGFAEDLFPPEKSIFNALFKNFDLHQEAEGQFKFVFPKEDSEIFPVFRAIENFIEASQEPVAYQELKELMAAPPFGIKEGLMPLIFMAFYFARENNIALYEDNIFRPYMDVEAIERFSKKTNAFSFQLFNFQTQQELINRYGNILLKDDSKTDTLTLVKEISKIMRFLPAFVKNTRLKLSNEAIKFRTAFATSKSPQDLLTKDIPNALGYKEEMQDAELAEFSNKFDKVLSEFKSCYELLLKEQLTKFNQAFEYESQNLKSFRENVFTDYADLEEYSVDPDVKNFIRKINQKEIEDQMWFESLLSFLVKRHPEKWEDEDLATSEFELRKISDKLRELRKLGIYDEKAKNTKSDEDSEVYLLRTKKKGEEGFEELFSLSSKEKEELSEIAAEIDELMTKKFKKNDQKIAALTALLNSMLEGKTFGKINKANLKVVKKDD